MEIKDFIEKTLVDLTLGIKGAGEFLGNENRFKLTNVSLRTVPGGSRGIYGLIEFDLAVSVDQHQGKGAKGGIGISVISVEAGTKNDLSNSSISRIKFIIEDINSH